MTIATIMELVAAFVLPVAVIAAGDSSGGQLVRFNWRSPGSEPLLS